MAPRKKKDTASSVSQKEEVRDEQPRKSGRISSKKESEKVESKEADLASEARSKTSTKGKASKVPKPSSTKDAKSKKSAEKKRKGGNSEDGERKRPKSSSGDMKPGRVEQITNAKDIPHGLKRDSRGRLIFDDFKKFRPTLTPKQIIQAGSFGGIYFNPMGGRKSLKYPKGVPITADEFPKDWFEGLRAEQYKGTRYNVKLNRYQVKSGQNQQQWEEQGWIREQDPRGWFQWYCRFVLGRRTDDDKRQISRWTGVAGPKGRWKTRLFNLVRDKGGDISDGSISPVIRQNLLHWAYELTEEDYEAMLKGDRY